MRTLFRILRTRRLRLPPVPPVPPTVEAVFLVDHLGNRIVFDDGAYIVFSHGS